MLCNLGLVQACWRTMLPGAELFLRGSLCDTPRLCWSPIRGEFGIAVETIFAVW
jgi:hypothetical protein